MTELPLLDRQCGECNACCVAPCAEDLGKPGNVPCKHLNGNCTIYDTRPEVCRTFQCAWKVGLSTDDERPDKLGVMFSISMAETRHKIEVYELREGALKEIGAVTTVSQLIASFENSPQWDLSVYPLNVPYSQEDRYKIDEAYPQKNVHGDYIMAAIPLKSGGTMLVHVGCISIPGGDLYLPGKYVDRKYAPRYLNDDKYMKELVCALC